MPDNNNTEFANRSLDIHKGLSDRQAFLSAPIDNSPLTDAPIAPLSGPQQPKPQTVDSAFSDLGTTLASGKRTATPFDYGTLNEEDVPRSERKIPGEYYPGMDNNEIRAKQQSFGQKMLYGTERGGVSLLKGAADIVGLIPDLIYSIPGVGDKTQGFVNNDYNKLINDFKTSFDESHPLYETQEQKNSWLPTANTLPKGIDVMASLAGMFFGTKGLGLLAKGAQLSKLAGIFGAIQDAGYVRNIEGLQNLSEQLAMYKDAGNEFTKPVLDAINKAGIETTAKSMDEVGKSITDAITNLNKRRESFASGYNSGIQGAVRLVGNLGMASSMGNESGTAYSNAMYEKIRGEQGREPTDDEKAKIKDYAKSVSQVTAALTGAMGLFTLSGLTDAAIGKGFFKKVGEEEVVDIYAENKLTKEIGVANSEKFSQMNPDELDYMAKPGFKPTAASKVGQFGQKSWNVTKTAGKFAWNHLDLPAGFTMAEFGLAGQSVNSYYETKYDNNDADVFTDGILPNLKALASPEGVGTVIMGALGAAVLEGLSGHGKEERKQQDKFTSDSITLLKDVNRRNDFITNLKASLNRQGPINREILDAHAAGDKKTALDATEASLQNYLYPRLRAGMKSSVDYELKSWIKLAGTDEGINELKAKGYIPQDADIQTARRDFIEHINKLQEKVNKADNSYKAIKRQIGTDPAYGNEHIEKLMYLQGMSDNATERISDINKELLESKLTGAVSTDKETLPALRILQNIYPMLSNLEKNLGEVGKGLSEVEKQIKALPITETEQQDILNKLNDMVKLAVDRHHYIQDYKSIINKPKEHTDLINKDIKTTGDTDNTIKGNKLNPVRTKNKQPVAFEVGKEYYAGSKIVPGISEKGERSPFLKFQKFKVLGENVDESGKRKIVIENELGHKYSVPEEVFSKYKIGSVDDLAKPENRNAKYWFNNRNSIYEFDMGSRGKKRGRLHYDSDTDTFSFVYPDINEKGNRIVRETEVTKDQFRDKIITDEKGGITSRGAKIKKVGEVSEDDLQWLSAKESEKEVRRRQEKLFGKLDVLGEEVKKKRDLLKKVEDDLLDHEIKLERVHKTLQETKEKFDNYPQRENKGNLTKDTKKFLSDSIGTIRELSTIAKETQDNIDRLQSQANDIRDEIDYIQDIQVDELPDGEALLHFIKDLNKNAEDHILDIGNKINTLSKFIDNVKNVIKTGLSNLSKYLNKIRGSYPDIEIPENVKLLPNSIDHYVDNVQSITGEAPSELLELRKGIQDATEIDIPVRESDIQKAYDQIDDLYKELKTIDKEMKVNDELYKAFADKLEKFKQQKKREEELRTPEMMSLLQKIQGNNDAHYDNDSQNLAAYNGKVFDPKAKKSISTIYLSSVQRPETTPDNNFYQKRANILVKNWNMEFSGSQKQPGKKHITDNPKWKEDARIIVVTKQNQHHYFPENVPLIEDNYKHPITGDVISNSDNTDRATVNFVRTARLDGKDYFMDQEGNLLSVVGEGNADRNQIIYESMESVRPDKDIAIPEDMKDIAPKYTEWAKKERARIVSNTSQSLFFPYRESAGFGNYDLDAEGKRKPLKNSVSEASIIPDNKISGGSIVVPTQKSGNRVQVGDNIINGSSGRPMVVFNNNSAFLNGIRLGDVGKDFVNNLYNIIKAAAKSRGKEIITSDGKTVSGAIDPVYMDHLRKVIYIGSKTPEEGISNSQMYINDQGLLAFKLKGQDIITPTFFDVAGVETYEDEIKQWLSDTIHTVSKGDLSKPFYEITKVNYGDNGELLEPTTRKWETYEQYIMSQNSPDGKRSFTPMSVNIKAGPEEHPFNNKYIIPDFHGEYFDRIDFEKTLPKKEAVPELIRQPETKSIDNNTIQYKGNTVTLDGIKINEQKLGDGVVKYTAKNVDGKVEVNVTEIDPDGYENDFERTEQFDKLNKILSGKLTDALPKTESKVEIKPETKQEEVHLTIAKTEPVKTPESEFENFIKAGRSRGNVDLYEISPFDIINSLDNPTDVKIYIESQIPQIKFEELPDFIKTGRGTMAYGQYRDKIIQLYRGAPEGTGMHEVLHAVEDAFLNQQEIADTRSEFRNREGDYTDRFGNKIDYKHATERDIREKLADEFKEFAKQNPDYTPGTKIGNFFKRVYNFINHVIFGNPTKINDIFKRINSGYYRDSKFIQKPASDVDYSEMKGFSELEKKNVLHGFYNRIIDNLEKSNGGLVRFADGNISEEQIFENLFQSMDDYFGNPTDKPNVQSNIWNRVGDKINAIDADNKLTPEQKERVIHGLKNETIGAYRTWEKIMANEQGVKEDLKSYMRKYKLVFDKLNKPEDLENETQINREEDNDYSNDVEEDDRDRGYESNTLTYDAKENSTLPIKLLFSNLVNTEESPVVNQLARFGDTLRQPVSKLTSLLLPELVSGTQYMNKVLDGVSGLSTPQSVQEALFEMAKSDPVLIKLYNSIYKEVKNRDDYRLRIGFYKFAQTVKPDVWFLDIGEDSNTTVKNSNIDTDARTIVSDWESDFRGDSSGLTLIENNVYKLDPKKLKNSPTGSDRWGNTKKFLNEIKFPIENLDRLSNDDRNKLVIASGDLYNALKSGMTKKEISSKSLDQSSLGKVAAIISKASPISSASSRQNMDGMRVQNHQMPNTISRMFSEINNVTHLDQLPDRYKNDTWCKNSQLLKRGGQIFDESGAKRKDATKLNVSMLDGAMNQNTDSKIGMGNVNGAVRSVINLNMNLEGIYSNFIAADSQSEVGTKVKQYITVEDLKTDNHYKEFNKIATGYLKDEIDLIKENNIPGKRILTSAARKNDNYKKLQVFKDILPELAKEITDYANKPGTLSTDEFIKTIQDRVNEGLKRHIDKIVNADKEYFQNSQVLDYFEKSDKFKFYGLNGEFLQSAGMKKEFFTDADINKILSFRAMNLFTHLTEMRKLFYGPWYEVGDAPKRDKTSQSGTITSYSNDEQFNSFMNNDQKSGDISLTPDDSGYRTYKNSFNQIVVAEPKTRSRAYEQLHKLIGDLAKPYGKIDEMDAQGIMSPGAWKEYKMRSADKWSEQDEQQHQYDMAAHRKAYYERERIDKSKYRKELQKADNELLEKGNPNTKDTGNPLKPLGSGMQSNNMQSIPYLDKTSVFRNTYPIAKGRGLEDLYWFMYDNDISVFGPESFMKFGRPFLQEFEKSGGGLPHLYNEEGLFNLNSLSKDQLGKLNIDIPWHTFNKIVETAKSGEGTSRGTQMLSLITVNSNPSGIPIDFWNPESDDLKAKQDQWNTMSEADKRATSDMYRLKQDNNKAIVERSQRGYEDSLKSLGITDHGDSYSFNDPKKLIDYLKNEVTRRDLPDNILMGIEEMDINPTTGDDVLRNKLETNANYQELNNLLWSLGTQNILKPKLNGTSNILVSSTGFEKRGVKRVEIKDGKSVLVSSELNYYKKGEKGADGKIAKTSLVEVYAPNHLIKELKKAGSQLTDKELFKHLNTPEGQELLEAVGFRIPTQGMNSLDAIKIVPWDAENNQYFLPADMGNSMIVPSELVTKVGLDFDVDKMPTYHYNFYIDRDGYPHKVKFVDNVNDDKSLERLYKSKYSKKEREGILGSKLLSGITGQSDIGEQIPTLEQFIQEHKGKGDPWKLNSKEAIENKYIDTLKEFITHPLNFEQLVIPNSSDQLEGIQKSIDKKLNPDASKRDKNDINYSNLLDPQYLSRERQDYRDATGKSIGIVAQNNTFHALSQQKFIPIDDHWIDKIPVKDKKWLPDTKILLPHTKVKYGNEMKTVLSSYKNPTGSYVSDFISQLINGAVDAVKNKWMIELLKQKDLLSVATFLGRVAADPDYIFHFTNQPIIQEYVRLDNINRDIRILRPDIKRVSDSNLFKLMNEKLGLKIAAPIRTTDFSMKEMSDVLEATGLGKKLDELTNEQKVLQAQVLREYMKYKTLAQHMLDEQLGVVTGNMQRLNETQVSVKNKRVEKAKQSSAIGAMRSLDGETYNSELLGIANKFQDAKNTITEVAGDDALKEIRETFSNPNLYLKNSVREKVINKSLMSLIDFATQVHGKINKDIKRVMFGNESVANKLIQGRGEVRGDLKDVLNKVLGTIRPDIDLNEKSPKTIQLLSKPLTAVESDIMTESLRTLRDNPTTNQLFNDIVIASYLGTGSQSARGGYRKFLPNENVMAFMRPVIDKILSENMSAFNETKAMYRNSWMDKDIVPVARKNGYGGDGYDFIKNTEPRLIYKHELYDGKDLNYPVLQFSEMVKKPDGQVYSKYERDQMAKRGDYSFRRTGLLQKVMDESGNPLVAKIDNGNKVYIYKQINAWGDGNRLQEHWDTGRPSENPKNWQINEMTDRQVEEMLSKLQSKSESVREESVIPKSETKPDTKSIAEQNKLKENKPKPC